MKADRARAISSASDGAETCSVDFVNEENVAHVLAEMPSDDALERAAAPLPSAWAVHACDFAAVAAAATRGCREVPDAGKAGIFRLENSVVKRLVWKAYARHEERAP